jgi:hypothetical protein
VESSPAGDDQPKPEGEKAGAEPLGDKNCQPKPKQPKPREVTSFVGTGGLIGEITFDKARQPQVQFEVWKDGGEVAVQRDHWPLADGNRLVPPADKRGLIDKGVVRLPSRAADYVSQAALIAEIIAFIHRYADVPSFWEELIAHYILMTWVFDRFTAVPYLRFLGEPQSGKTRCLQVAGQLCYKSIIAGGATTAAPLFRLLEVYRGTFVIDEADYKNSDLSSEIIKILNCGYMRGLPVLRAEKSGDNYEPRTFDVFGPKILTTRKEFADHALETRCLTLRTGDRQVRPDIPRQLPRVFSSEALALRNKLLRWRFDNFLKIQSDESKLLALEPRLTQIGAPLYSVATDDGFRERLVKFLGELAEEHDGERPNAIVAEAIRQLLANQHTWPATLTIKAVRDKANEVRVDWDSGAEEFTAKRAGGLVRSLGFETRRANTGYEFTVTKAKLGELVTQYPPKFPRGDQP